MPIIITNRFKKAYQGLPPQTQNKVKKALRLLYENLDRPSQRVRNITGVEYILEGQIDWKYRISFQFEDDDVIVRNVDSQDECLKNL